jgi:hypothetical protein
VAIALARIVLPLWFLSGAVLKLMDSSPSHLPVPIIKGAGVLGLDLQFVLWFSIAFELIVVGVMWLLPGLARPVGLLVLGAFLPVLISELLMGSASCGCFGAVEVHPAITLTLDLGFFLGLWVLGRNVPSLKTTTMQPTWRVLAVGFWTIASIVLAFGVPTSSSDQAPNAETGTAAAAAIPAEGYYLPQYDQWIGTPWDDIQLSTWMRNAPEDLDSGQHYMLFYRKDCEHCHELMEAFFTGPLTTPTTAVAVPERTGFPEVGVQEFACDACRLAELPSGVDWFLATPVLVRLLDGVVECAAEVTADDPQCLIK